MARNRAKIGFHSRLSSLAKLDGRRAEARRLATIEADLRLFAANGTGQISIAQNYLARRLAIDLLRLELLDVEMATGTISEADARVAHSLRNATRLGLRDLRRSELAPTPQPKSRAATYDDRDELARLIGSLP